MSTVKTEQIMVVPTELFHSCGYFQGFCAEPNNYLETLLLPSNTQYLPRDEMEQDPSFKQLIPYCIFQHTDDTGAIHVFQYTRGKGAGESRLHSKKSVGIGGHISTLDSDDVSPYNEGMRRELEEEITINCGFTQQLVGLINDDENEVGKVHLGVVHIFNTESREVESRETEIAQSGFLPIDQILADLDSYETWSKICLSHLFGNP